MDEEKEVKDEEQNKEEMQRGEKIKRGGEDREDLYLLEEFSLWTRCLLLVFGIHTHVEFVLAQGATQQGEHQEEPHGSVAGEHDRHQQEVHFLFHPHVFLPKFLSWCV